MCSFDEKSELLFLHHYTADHIMLLSCLLHSQAVCMCICEQQFESQLHLSYPSSPLSFDQGPRSHGCLCSSSGSSFEKKSQTSNWTFCLPAPHNDRNLPSVQSSKYSTQFMVTASSLFYSSQNSFCCCSGSTTIE